MEIKLNTFGKISEIIKDTKLEISNITDTNELKIHLENQFPVLKTMKYKMALNEILIQDNTLIPDHSTLALMPPFSGG
jgi:molybdopterin synthase sulfur carrier subunit